METKGSLLHEFYDVGPPPSWTNTPIFTPFKSSSPLSRCLYHFSYLLSQNLAEKLYHGQLWATVDAELIQTIQDDLENHVTSHFYEQLFSNHEDEQKDLALAKRIRGLRWIRPEHLEAQVTLDKDVSRLERDFQISSKKRQR